MRWHTETMNTREAVMWSVSFTPASFPYTDTASFHLFLPFFASPFPVPLPIPHPIFSLLSLLRYLIPLLLSSLLHTRIHPVSTVQPCLSSPQEYSPNLPYSSHSFSSAAPPSLITFLIPHVLRFFFPPHPYPYRILHLLFPLPLFHFIN